ncbi:hypothetical protein GYMLUDRAFT_239531 [Collybiopsis luxurians FD-317 M1]|nr:hypothetical protein GYMLUDRAFT_239531 [Collybiopsis luxurians FD-317 M1]
MDDNPHSLQEYQDITGEWASSNLANFIQWNTTTTDSIIYHEVQHFPFQYMTELNNMAEDGVVYHVTNAGSSVTYQTGKANTTREAFLNNGNLNNSEDTAFRAIQDSINFPTFTFSSDLGIITYTSSPVVWGIGLVQSGNIIYATNVENQTCQPYFFTRYSDVPIAISNFMNDASDALQRAMTLDEKIIAESNEISSGYADLVLLASRQVMAGMEITVGTDSNGRVNDSDVLIFMKDTGNSQGLSVAYLDVSIFLPSVSGDGLRNANMSNLAVKGIIAIHTMAEISHTMGKAEDYN